VAQMVDRTEDRSVVPKADRSVVQRVVRKEDRSEVPKVGRSGAQMEVPKEGRSEVSRVDRMAARTEGRKVVRKEAQKADRSGVRKVVPRVDRTGECLEGSGRMAEPVEVLLRLQVGVVEVRWRFPLRVQVGPRAVLPEPRARALPKSQARGLPAWKEAVRAGGQRRGVARPQEVPQEPERPAHDVLVLVKGEGRWRR
jgi:hypothetical protein